MGCVIHKLRRWLKVSKRGETLERLAAVQGTTVELLLKRRRAELKYDMRWLIETGKWKHGNYLYDENEKRV